MLNPQFTLCKSSKVIGAIGSMSELLRASDTLRGKPAMIDANNFKYTLNFESTYSQSWRCSTRSCPATIRTRKSTGQLVSGMELPSHTHSNNLMKTVAKTTENEVVNHLASFQPSTPSFALQDIASKMLSSNVPDKIEIWKFYSV